MKKHEFDKKKKFKIQNEDPKTTGYQWDGIEEFENPDPSWLRLLFYCALIFSIIYWMLYPSWPVPNDKGLLNWSSVKQLNEGLEEIQKIRDKYQVEFDKSSFEEIMKNPKLLEFALNGGKSAFSNNCAVCHGAGGGGRPGYPNLKAGSWLWGGDINSIYTTIKYGIRSDHEETKQSEMAAFGDDNILTADQISILAKYVMTLDDIDGEENKKKMTSEEYKKGVKLFAENCASCHGKDGEGKYEFGSRNLRDKIWLYGGDYENIYETIYHGRAGVMPRWEGKLSDTTIRQLAIYVHNLGGGQ